MKSISVALLILTIFLTTLMNSSQVAEKVDTIIDLEKTENYCNPGYSCDKPCSNLASADCLVNAFLGCTCPPGYALVITTAPGSYQGNVACQQLCTNTAITGCNTQVSIPQCLGVASITPTGCQISSFLASILCDGGSCGNFYAYNGNYYCIQADNSSSPSNNPCFSGYGSQCSIISTIDCATAYPPSPIPAGVSELRCTARLLAQRPSPSCCNFT